MAQEEEDFIMLSTTHGGISVCYHYFAWFNRAKFLPRLQSHCVSSLVSVCNGHNRFP